MYLGFDAAKNLALDLVQTIRSLQAQFRDWLSPAHPENVLERIPISSGKVTLRIDKMAEEHGRIGILEALKTAGFDSHEISYWGEERLANAPDGVCVEADIQNCKAAVLVDLVDGTDLLERGLQNWCSAIVLHAPAEQRILGAFVGIEGVIPGHAKVVTKDGVYSTVEHDPVYFAMSTHSGDIGPRKISHEFDQGNLVIRDSFYAKTLEDASIAFYGQKAANLLSIYRRPRFVTAMETLGRKAGCRVYNFAGIPMTMRMLDPVPGATRGIDAIFDVPGQQPHDAVPGLYIALKAGVTIVALDDVEECGIRKGEPIDEAMLSKALIQPKKRKLPYAAAPEPQLAHELAHLLTAD